MKVNLFATLRAVENVSIPPKLSLPLWDSEPFFPQHSRVPFSVSHFQILVVVGFMNSCPFNEDNSTLRKHVTKVKKQSGYISSGFVSALRGAFGIN